MLTGDAAWAQPDCLIYSRPHGRSRVPDRLRRRRRDLPALLTPTSSRRSPSTWVTGPSEYADLVGGFVVSDVKIADLSRPHGSSSEREEGRQRLETSVSRPLGLNLVVTGGAGAIEPAVTWVRGRRGSRLRAVEFALRDEEDLAHNARRLVHVVDSLAEELDDVTVYAEAPDARRPISRLAGCARRAGGPRDRPEVPHRRADGGPLPLLLPAGRLPRGGPRPRAAVQVHGRAAQRRTPPRRGDRLRAPRLPQRPAGHARLPGRGSRTRSPRCSRQRRRRAGQAAAGRPRPAARTRRWFESFGSCSVLEAHEDLVELGLM